MEGRAGGEKCTYVLREFSGASQQQCHGGSVLDQLDCVGVRHVRRLPTVYLDDFISNLKNTNIRKMKSL